MLRCATVRAGGRPQLQTVARRRGWRVASTSSAAASEQGHEHHQQSKDQSSSNNRFRISSSTALVASAALAIGFAAGRSSVPDHDNNHEQHNNHTLPNGLPRTCCEDDTSKNATTTTDNLTESQRELPQKLKRLLGKDHVLDGTQLNTATANYLKGARLGQGRAYLIVTPTRLHHVEAILDACLAAGCVVLPQGQNTGLTGGSVPRHGNNDSRPVVVLSLQNLKGIFPIDGGKRVVCMAGVGLASVRSVMVGFLWQV